MSYSPPANDAVNFDEGGSTDQTIQASPLTLTLELPEPTIESGLIRASPLSLSLEQPEPSVEQTVFAAPLSLNLNLPEPSVEQTVFAAPLTLILTEPAPTFEAGTASISASPLELLLTQPEPTVTLSIGAAPLSLDLIEPEPVIGSVDWIIESTALLNLDTVEFDAKTVTLSGVAAGYRLRHLRNIRAGAEKVNVVANDEGRFRAVDRSLNGNVYKVTPPVDETPPHTSQKMLVADYNETRVSRDSEKQQLEIVFQKPESRDPTGSEPSQTASTGEWLFEFWSGSIATRRVTPERESAVEIAKDVESLQLTLTAEQMLVLATSATYPDAASVVEIPDGDNLARDNSSSNRQTVDVTAPSGKEGALASGTYVVSEWTATRLDSDSYEVALNLRPKA
jgi:hypothetical protein